MGDFGNINYNVEVPSAAQRWEQAGQTVKGAFEGAGQALMAYQQGVLRNEAVKATTNLSMKLNDAHTFIQTHPYITHDQAREVFQGRAWDDLDPALKDKIDKGPASPDDPGLSMGDPALAGALFRKVAKEATEQSADMISTPGWKNEFLTQAQGTVNQYHNRVVEAQFEHYRADGRLNEQTGVQQAINAQDFETAKTLVRTMHFYSPAEREVFMRTVEKGEQTLPLKSATLSQDPEKVQAAIDKLASSPESFDKVPEAEQELWASKLEAHQYQLQKRAEHQQAQKEKFARGAATERVFASFRQSLASGDPIPMSVVPDPDLANGITPETSENLLNLVEKMNKRDQKSNLAVRQDLITLRARDNVTFQQKNLLQAARYLSPEDYFALEKMQMEDRMKSADAGHAKELARMHSDKVDAINEFTGNKLTPHTKPEDKAKMDSLEYALDQGIEAWQKKNPGKYPDRETITGIANLTLGTQTGMLTSASGSEVLTREPLYVQSAIIKDVKQSGRLGTPEIYAAKLKDWKAQRDKLVDAWDVHAPGDTPSEQALYDVYRALNDPKTVDRLNLDLAIKHRVLPTESARLQLLIGQYASESARLKASDRRAADATEQAALEEARRATKANPPPTSRVPAPLPAGD